MFNLFIVNSNYTNWIENNKFLLDRSRFLEYTDEDISSNFRGALTIEQKEALISMPCLFMYEQFAGPTYIGNITSINFKGRMIEIYYNINNPITIDNQDNFSNKIGIEGFEIWRTHWAIKNINLDNIIKNIIVSNNITIKDLKFNYNNDVSIINSLSDFIKVILTIEKNESEIFYRGHSDKLLYKLKPSLFRFLEGGEPKYIIEEHKMYRELLISNSKDFIHDYTTLDKLVRMQHYGLPTRLLDITSNPLISLYFACSEFNTIQKTGEVIIFKIKPDKIKYFDSDSVSCIANLARLAYKEKENINYKISDINGFNNQPAIIRLIELIKEEKLFFEPRIQMDVLKSVFCLKSKRSNDRISSQSGSFLIFGQDAQLNEDGMSELGIDIVRLEIDNKLKILKELDQLNINLSTVFPNIENSAKYIKDKFSK